MPDEPIISLIIPVLYALTSEGRVLVLQLMECQACGVSFDAFIDMSLVKDDKVTVNLCPCCNEETVEVVTFRGEQEEDDN